MPRLPSLIRRWTAVALLPAALAGIGWSGAAAASTITLRGTVNHNCFVSVQDLGVGLNIRGGQTAVVVGRIDEYCNDKDGYTVTFASTNSGALVTGAGATRAAYEVSYETSGSWRTLGTPFQLTRTKRQTSTQWRDLWVRMPAQPQALAGAYWDTITVTIAAR